MVEFSDDELMQAIGKGDHGAFATLVRRHIDALYNYAFRLSNSATTAEDLVQETWLTVWRKPKSYNAKRAKLNTWLFSILHNKFVDQVRRQKTQRLAKDIETSHEQPHIQQLVDDTNPEQTVFDQQSLTNTRALIERLPIAQRAALTLNYAQGMGNKEIAQVMGQSVRAVESLLARARRTLRENAKLNSTHVQSDRKN